MGTEDLANNLEEQLGNMEDVMDKKINTDIMPRIGHLDNIVSDIDKDVKSRIAFNTKAISDLQTEVAQSITDKLNPTEDKINNLDTTIQDVNKTLAIFDGRHLETVEKMKEMTVITNNIQVQIQAQEQKMIEQGANDLNQIRDQLRDIENQAGLSGQKIQELDAGSQTLQEKVLGIENQMADRLDDLVKSDASILAKINGLESNNDQIINQLTINLEKKIVDSENKILLEVESVNKQTEDLANNLEEQLGNMEDVMEKKINTEIMPRIGHLDNIVSDIDKDVKSRIASNTKAISDLQTEVAQSITDKLKPTEDKINNLDTTIQDVNKTLAIFDGRHLETVITNNIQVQIKAQEQKMIEQSANDLNQIRDQLRDIENQAGLSGQKIQELDRGSQTLQEKVLGMENQVTDRLDDLVKSDASIVAKINGLESNTPQNINQSANFLIF